MSSTTFVAWLNQFRADLPFTGNQANRRTIYARMVRECDKDGLRCRSDLFDTAGDRYAHRTIGIWVSRKRNVAILQMRTHLIGAMTGNYDDFLKTGAAQLLHTNLYDRSVTERK